MAANDTSTQVREATLPGIGKKYVMSLEAGGNLAIIVRPDGERQLYHFLEHEDRPCDVVKVSSQEAQQIANLLGKPLVPAPDLENLDLVLGMLEIEWVTLDERSPLLEQTLGASQLRKKTGASVVAVMRDGKALPNPDIGVRFKLGDTLLLIGSKDQTDAARSLIES